MGRIEKARIAGKVNREAIEYGFQLAKPGVTLLQIDRELGEFIASHDECVPAFKNYRGFPGNACLSVNEVAVHGVPNDYILQDGDLLTVDIGTIYDGIYADAADTRVIGNIQNHSHEAGLSMAVKSILEYQLGCIQEGTTLMHIAFNGMMAAKKYNVSLVEELGGHYIGEQLHLDPFIPNCIDQRKGKLNVNLQEKKYKSHSLKSGDIICIEPVITIGPTDLIISQDGWTCSTQKLSAHAEHMILVTSSGYEILS